MPLRAPMPPKPAPAAPGVLPPMPPKRYRLTEDAKSTFRKGYVYGRKGDEVTEVSVSDPAVIVEAKDGSRFPINKSKLIQI